MANPYFNAQYYLTQNPDLLAAGINTVDAAWAHYVNYGAAEALNGVSSRSPAPWFDVKYYISANPDLVTSGLTGAQLFEHFVTYGINEGRVPSAAAAQMTDASLLAYAKGNADLATAFGVAADATSLTDAQRDGLANHYYEYGYKESRADAPFTPDTNPGETFTLTVGADNFTGTGGNDTFTAAQTTGNTWTVGDTIDGGAGTDTFNVTQTAAISNPVGATVKNIEIANLLSGTTGNDIDTTSWTGLTTLNVTGVTAQTITAAATTDVSVTGSTATGATAVNGGRNVTVTETGANSGTVGIGATTAAAGAVTVNSTILASGGATGNAITVNGGTDISITQKGVNAVNTTVTDGQVTVTGNANTKTVTIVNDKAAVASATVVGHTNGVVGITDVNAASATAAGTIESVSVTNAGAVTINSGALKTLDLAGTITSVNAGTLGALMKAANTELAVNVNGLTTTGAVTIDTDITTLNLSGNTAASTVNSLVANGAKVVNISGDAKVTLTDNTFGALESVVVTNTAGASLGTTAIAAGVSFTGGAGDDSVILSNAFTKAITMGAGNDTVTYGGAAGTGGSVDAGDGVDTIVMTGAQAAAASGSATFNNTFKNFDALTVSAGGAATINLAGINGVSTVNTVGQTGALVLNGFVSGGTVNLTGATGGAGGDVQAVITDAALHANDIVNLQLTNSTGAAVAFGKATAAGVETVNISTVDAGTGANAAATVDTLTLIAAGATKIVVSGNNGLDLTNTGNLAVTIFDASGVVGNDATDTAANLAVKFVSANTDATATVNITGGAGNDTLTGNAGKDIIIGGDGDDTITGGAGVDTMTGGNGVDTFVIAAGDAGITGGEKITDFNIALGGDKLDLDTTALIANATNVDVTSAVGGAVDVTATVKDGIITLGGADAALVNTVGHIKAIFELLDADNTAEVGAIALNGQTYVITDAASGGGADTVNDIIQLVGVSGVVSLSTVDAANSILIA